MKRMMALLLAAVLLLSLMTACGKTETPAADVPQTETPETPSTGDAATETPAEDENKDDCFWHAPELPVLDFSSIEDNLENRQKALVETAYAYYYKNMTVKGSTQYCRETLTKLHHEKGGVKRGLTEDLNTPEAATADHTLYTWCTGLCYESIYNSFNYKLLGNIINSVSLNLSQWENIPPEILLADSRDLTGDYQKDVAIIEDYYKILQPGDIICYTRKQDVNGHAFMVIPDISKDGKLDFIESTGIRYNLATGMDDIETAGTVVIGEMTKYLTDPMNNPTNVYNARRYTIYRPALVDPAKYPLTDSARTRLMFPSLSIERTVDTRFHGSVVAGGELTYTINVVNKSRDDYSGIPLFDVVPENCTLLSVDGVPVKEGSTENPAWVLDVPGRKSVTVTYTVRVDAKAGDLIVSHGGCLGGIPLNRLETTVQNFVPAAITEDMITAAAGESKSALEFANKLYEKANGLNPALPVPETIVASLLKENYTNGVMMYLESETPTDATLSQMQLHRWQGGKSLLEPAENRLLDLRQDTMGDIVQTGDIIVLEKRRGSGDCDAWVWTGEKYVTWRDGAAVDVTKKEYVAIFTYDYFALFRPSLAMTKA